MEVSTVMPSLSETLIERYRSLTVRQRWGAIGGLALFVAVLVAGIVFNSGGSAYKVIMDKSITSSEKQDVLRVLDEMGITPKTEGDKVLVPEDVAGRATLALSRAGLPRSRGSSMSEAMRQIPFGTTSLHEQVVEKEAKQNEIAATIETMDGVNRAKVQINIPKPSVFLTQEEKPSASVVVQMHKGFVLDKEMARSIVSIVGNSTGVSEGQVSVVDGRTGTVVSAVQSREGLNNSQLEYIDRLKHEREEAILRTLVPIAGQGKVMATVNVDVDFSKTEQTSENFKPNPQPNEAVVRSQHTKEATNPSGGGAGGVPGALSNQPPGAASAPLTSPGGTAGVNTATTSASSLSAQRESVVNYEVDKTIRHTRGGEWVIRRVTAAVVLTISPEMYNSKNKSAPFKNKEDFDKQFNELIKGAIGFDEKRGDTIQIVNTPFAEEEVLPAYKNPRYVALFRDVAINVLWVGVVLYLLLGVIRPLFRNLFSAALIERKEVQEVKDKARESELAQMSAAEKREEEAATLREEATAEASEALGREMDILEHDLAVVQAMIRQDPRMAAHILKQWMNTDE
jgi:flagellar M-ring protein FliF